MAKSIAAALLLVVSFSAFALIAKIINHATGSDLSPYEFLVLAAAYQAIKNDLRLSARPNTLEGET